MDVTEGTLVRQLKNHFEVHASQDICFKSPYGQSTRIFQWKNPASLRLRTAKGLLNLSSKENVSQTLSSSTSGLNPLPL